MNQSLVPDSGGRAAPHLQARRSPPSVVWAEIRTSHGSIPRGPCTIRSATSRGL